MRTLFGTAAMIAIFAAASFSQDEDRTMEAYAMGSYSRIAHSGGGLYVPTSGGTFYGAGFGAHAGLVGWQAEFLRSRVSGATLAPTMNTGAVNFLLEKRDGSIRPVFLVGAGGSVALKNYVFLQAGLGVTITLADGLFERPQVRAQLWQNGGLLGVSQTATCVGIAIGYRFAAP